MAQSGAVLHLIWALPLFSSLQASSVSQDTCGSSSCPSGGPALVQRGTAVSISAFGPAEDRPCFMQKDCAVSAWCAQSGFEAYCAAHTVNCPEPWCTRSDSEPEPFGNACLMQKDCTVSAWCNQGGYAAYCAARHADCPEPWCTRVVSATFSPRPTSRPTRQPTPQPTLQPTAQPTPSPTPQVSPDPTLQPTAQPQSTPQPTVQPTAQSTQESGVWRQWQGAGITFHGADYDVDKYCPVSASKQIGNACWRLDNDHTFKPNVLEHYCSRSDMIAFGHPADVECGECTEIRVLRQDGGFNMITVMTTDNPGSGGTTSSPELTTAGKEHLTRGTGKQLSDRLPFEWRKVDCSHGTSAPAPTPPPTQKPTAAGVGRKLIAYVENWKPCPSSEQIAGYTHAMISFAVTYQWAAAKNQCSDTCTIGSPVPICGNEDRQDLVDEWRASGTKVLLSFGGAGMGGSWAGDVNDCWEHCFDKVDSVVSQLSHIVASQRFDGVDIDYEYFLHKPEAVAFVTQLTTKLKDALPVGKSVSHAPMDGDLSEGKPYYNIIKSVASSLDYLMPQYYNGPFRPANDLASPTAHLQRLVSDCFGGDASKVLFGFCIADCSGTGSNIDGRTAVQIMQTLSASIPGIGGAFVWAASDDGAAATWSTPLIEAGFGRTHR